MSVAVLWSASAAAQTTLRIARIAGYPDQVIGSQILREIYSRLDIAVEFTDVPAARALTMSSTGEVDGEVHRILGVSEQVPTLLVVKPAINAIEPSAFARRDGVAFDTTDGWKTLGAHRVGIVRGVGSSERGTQGLPNVTAVTSQEMLFNMLHRGRFDVAVSDLFSGEMELRRMELSEEVRPLSPPLQRIDIYHYLHERHRDLVPKVEAVVRAMEASGALKQLQRSLQQRMLLAVKP